MNGTVGVITRTKNRPVLLKRALESLLNQSYQDWTLVIVNDGGDPASVDRLVAHYQARAAGRIRVIHNERSLGMETASNVGIRAIQCDYLAIHDDDDSWSPEFLTIAVADLARAHALHPRVMGVVTMANAVFERIEGNLVVIERVEEYKPWVNKGLISLDATLCESQFAPIQFLYRSEALAKTGLYREDLPVLGDWEFNIRFMSNYDIMVIPQVLAFHHHRGHDFHGVPDNNPVARRDQREFFHQFLKNEWLRNDLGSGVTSLGELVNHRPQIHHMEWLISQQIGKRMDELASRLDQVSGKISALESRRHPLRNLLLLGLLWRRSGRPLHYLKRFFESLFRQGPGETMRTVRLWFNIKRSSWDQG